MFVFAVAAHGWCPLLFEDTTFERRSTDQLVASTALRAVLWASLRSTLASAVGGCSWRHERGQQERSILEVNSFPPKVRTLRKFPNDCGREWYEGTTVDLDLRVRADIIGQSSFGGKVG